MSGAYVYTPAIWPPLVAGILLAAIAVYTWRRRSVPGAKPLVATFVLGILLLLGVAFQAAAVVPATKMAWYKFQFPMQLACVSAAIAFVLEYADPGRWLTRRNLVLLSMMPLLCALLAVVDDSQLIWRRLEVGDGGSVMLSYAPAGALLAIYGVGTILFNAVVLLRLFIRSPQHRWPVVVMLLGQAGGRTVFLLGISHPAASLLLDLSVLIVLLPMTAYAVALFGFQIFDPLPAARRSAVEGMRDGMVVFDPQWRVVSLNRAAANMTRSSASRSRGKPAAEILHAFGDLAARLAAGPGESFEVNLGSGAGARAYEADLSALRDSRDLLVGYLLMLRDVTERRRAEAQILEQQRSLAVLKERERLARELHDELGQVLGYAKMQAQAARDELAREQTATADEYLAQLVGVAQDAHDDVREYILATETTAGSHLDFLPALEAYLAQFAARYGIRTELVVAPGLSSDDFKPMVQAQLQRIIQEALTNTRKHGHAHCVQVRFQRTDGRAQITVQDDGVGFDPELQATSEGGHFGLCFLQERAQEVQGSVTIISSPGQGTRVEVDVPVTRQAGEGAPAL